MTQQSDTKQFQGKSVDEARYEIENYYLMGRSKKRKEGLRKYAMELFESLLSIRGIHSDDGKAILDPVREEELLDGCVDWKEYSYSGCSLISNEDICYRLCSDSVIQKKKRGRLPYKKSKTWLDLQADFLKHAVGIVIYAVNCHPSRRGSE